MAIEAVIFDYGGVLATSPFGGLARAEQQLGVAPGALTDLLGYGVDVAEPAPGERYTNKWHLLETGVIEVEEFAAWVNDRSEAVFGHRVDFSSRLFEAGASSMTIFWPVVHEVRRLRAAGYKTAILTNNVVAFRSTWETHVPLDLFDVVIDSSEVGVRKPDPAIYRLTAERLGVATEACVFLDDHPGNLVGARNVGMQAVHVRDDDVVTALAELRAILGD